MQQKKRYSIAMLCAELCMGRDEAKAYAQEMVRLGYWSEQRNDGRSRYVSLKFRRHVKPVVDAKTRRKETDALRGTAWAGLM